jgi:predicted nucleotidyltransferase component of viral defense system
VNIQDVIRECVVALFSNQALQRTLVLKGGTALHLVANIDLRLSLDIDFSVPEKIDDPAEYFRCIGSVLSEHFARLGYEVFDEHYAQKPKERAETHPEFWAGWSFEFKLIDIRRNYKDEDEKRRLAFVPEGSASSRIQLEISEYEYCGSTEKVKIGGSLVTSYSTTLLILEKLRALCQQHPNYPHGRRKNRARDYFDIYQLIKRNRSPQLYEDLQRHLPAVFAAKEVSLDLLTAIFEPDFAGFQRSHFVSVEATVKEKTESFEFYLEQLRLLLADLGYIKHG